MLSKATLKYHLPAKVLIKADMLDYYNVSGCYILRPWSYSIWEVIQGND